MSYILPELLASEFIIDIETSRITTSLWEDTFTAAEMSISNLGEFGISLSANQSYLDSHSYHSSQVRTLELIL